MSNNILKYNIHYIVIRGSADKEIRTGDWVRLEKCDICAGKFMLCLPPRHRAAMNHVRYFKTKEDLLKALKGIKIEPDKQWAKDMIKDYTLKIEKIKKEYGV